MWQMICSAICNGSPPTDVCCSIQSPARLDQIGEVSCSTVLFRELVPQTVVATTWEKRWSGFEYLARQGAGQ